MPSFILETYATRLSPEGLTARVERARAAAVGSSVRHLRSYFVPEDDMCMHVFEGPSAEAVKAIADSAGLEIERIVQSVGELADSTTRRDT